MATNEKDLNFLPEGCKLEISLRNSEDLSVNEYGEYITGICIASNLGTLNERTTDDIQRHLTYLGYNACRTADLVLSSEATLLDPAIIQYLLILELDILSDHKPVLLKFSI